MSKVKIEGDINPALKLKIDNLQREIDAIVNSSAFISKDYMERYQARQKVLKLQDQKAKWTEQIRI